MTSTDHAVTPATKRPLRTTQAALVILDISGYTSFIHRRVVSLAHAEDIITDLMETIASGASHPLVVNKLEGDAVLLFAELSADPAAAARSVLAQVAAIFPLFSDRLRVIASKRANCGCDACANVRGLKLKALLHLGDIAIKRVLQFEEIAGDAVILIHRLLKNSVPSNDYLLLTDDYLQAVGDSPVAWQPLDEDVSGMACTRIHWCPADEAALLPADWLANDGAGDDVAVAAPQRLPGFRHLPSPWWAALGRRLVRWMG